MAQEGPIPHLCKQVDGKTRKALAFEDKGDHNLFESSERSQTKDESERSTCYGCTNKRLFWLILMVNY